MNVISLSGRTLFSADFRDRYMIAIIFVPFMIFGVLGVMWLLNNKSWKARQDPFASAGDHDPPKNSNPSEDKSV